MEKKVCERYVLLDEIKNLQDFHFILNGMFDEMTWMCKDLDDWDISIFVEPELFQKVTFMDCTVGKPFMWRGVKIYSESVSSITPYKRIQMRCVKHDYVDALRYAIDGDTLYYKLYKSKFGGNEMPTDKGLNTRFCFVDNYAITKLKMKKVIFHDPATIVYWNDGTKTVVKANNGDEFDAEKGLAMAVVKKTIGLKEFYKVCERDKDGNEVWPCKWEEK